jgi:hypothetical protein
MVSLAYTLIPAHKNFLFLLPTPTPYSTIPPILIRQFRWYISVYDVYCKCKHAH